MKPLALAPGALNDPKVGPTYILCLEAHETW